MNRIKELLKIPPTREDRQPINILYRDDILFEDKTAEYISTQFEEKIKNIFNKQTMTQKKPKNRIRIIDDEEETQPSEPVMKKERKPARKVQQIKVSEEEEEEKEEKPEKFEETKEEESDFNNISNIIEFIRRNKQGRIPNIENAYYMNNRKRFVEFIKRRFGKYQEELASITKPASCDSISSDKKLSLLVHQKLITDYLNKFTPYRGLLLYHGLGSGKTCSSIAIAENFKNPNKQVIVMTPASLKPNFIKEIKKCGDFVYRINNNWIWQSYEKIKKHASLLEAEMYLSEGYIKKNGGAWVIDRESNGKTLTRKNKDAMNSRAKHTLDEQLNEMIQKRYRHISYNGIRTTHLSRMTNEFTTNPFDNKVVIVDEAHKFISPIVNKIRETSKSKKKAQSPVGVALMLYEYLLSAKNARVILLSGTPIVNYPNETAVLYNILRGYIHTYELKVRVRSSEKITNETLTQMFSNSEVSKQIDYFYYSPSESTLTITRNPFQFLNQKTSKGTYSGVKLDTEDTEGVDVNNAEFIQAVKRELKRLEIDVERVVENDYKNLPDSLDSFMNRFYSGVNMINKNQLSNRLVGLTSYFSGTPELLPRYSKEENYHIVNVPMSTYQAEQYGVIRMYELSTEKNKRRKKLKDEFEEQPSSYMIFSRLACNFVMPEDIPRPKPEKNIGKEVIEKKKGGDGSDGRDDEVEEDDVEDDDVDDMDDVEEADEFTEGGAKKEGDPEKPKRKYVRKPKEVVAPITIPEPQIKEGVVSSTIPEPQMKEGAPEKPKRKYVRKPKESVLQRIPEGENEGEEGTDELEFKDAEEQDADSIFNDDTTYNEKIAETLRELNKRGDEYLSPEGLQKYSPKFLRIIENIKDPRHEGLHLVYSQFRTMEGIGIFSLALNHNGFAEFKISKNPANNSWMIDVREEDIEKPKYALYTGKESKEVKEIIMNIYNGFFDLVPPELVSVLRSIAPNNNMGEFIKIFMITASGAEGLDLKNTRYVHLMEPFWNFVRVEQVIGRAVRICSHKNLSEEYRTVEAFIYMSAFSEEQLQAYKNKNAKKLGRTVSKDLYMVMTNDESSVDKSPITTDQFLYEISMRKEEAISQLVKVIKETSIDCTVYPSNQIEGLQCFTPDSSSLSYSYQPNFEDDLNVSLKKNIV